jgi:hypothetical protein
MSESIIYFLEVLGSIARDDPKFGFCVVLIFRVVKKLDFKLAFVKSDATLALPREFEGVFGWFGSVKPLFHKALNGVPQKILVDYVSIAVFGEVKQDFCAEAIFHFVIENLVKQLKSSDTKHLETLILQIVSVEVVKHPVQQFDQHGVVVPYLQVGSHHT